MIRKLALAAIALAVATATSAPSHARRHKIVFTKPIVVTVKKKSVAAPLTPGTSGSTIHCGKGGCSAILN